MPSDRLEASYLSTYKDVPISRLRAELGETLALAKEVQRAVAGRVGKLKNLFALWTRGGEVCTIKDIGPWLAAYSEGSESPERVEHEAMEWIMLVGGEAPHYEVREADVLGYYRHLIWELPQSDFNIAINHMFACVEKAKPAPTVDEKENTSINEQHENQPKHGGRSVSVMDEVLAVRNGKKNNVSSRSRSGSNGIHAPPPELET